MSWQRVDVWQWFCDGCPEYADLYDDSQPTDWIHTQDGRDLCPGCQA